MHIFPCLLFTLAHCLMLTKHQLLALKYKSFFLGKCLVDGKGFGGVEGLLSSHKNTNTIERHNRDCKSKLIDTFPHYRAVKHMHTRRLYGNKMGRVQAPLTSHISCMTAFHHRGRLDQEVRSYLCEFLTAKCC